LDKKRRVAKEIEIERMYRPDREAMKAALRVVLSLPAALPAEEL
jgi:hypothetical protein